MVWNGLFIQEGRSGGRYCIAQRAIVHVAALSTGPAPGTAIALRLNFHPDRCTMTSRCCLARFGAPHCLSPDRVLYR